MSGSVSSITQARKAPTAWPSRILPVLVMVLTVLLGLHRIIAADLWLHLAAGRWIVEHARVPRVDVFSFTAAGHPWIDLHWGYQLLVTAVHGAFGAIGIQLLHALALAGGLAILLARIQRQGASGLAWLFAALGILAGSERILCRPEMFTFLFLAAAWLTSERIIAGERPSCWWLALQVLWANMQGLFMLGPALFAIRAIGAGVDLRRRGSRIPRWAARRLLVAALLMTLVSVINPYGLRGLALPFRLIAQLTGQSVYGPLLAELVSPFEGRVIPILFMTTAVTALTAWVVDSRRRVSDLLPILAFGALALSGRRNVLLFQLVALCPTAAALSRLAARLPPALGRVIDPVVGLVLAGAILWVAGDRFYYEIRSPKETGFGFSTTEYPVAATRFLKERAGGGRVFNSLSDGGYLIWHLGSAWKVLFDGRAEVYGEDLGREIFSTYVDPERFNALADHYQIHFILMETAQPFGRRFVRQRFDEGGWSLLFADHRGAVMGRGEGLPPAQDLLSLEAAARSEPLAVPKARPLRPWHWRARFPREAARLGRLYSELGAHRTGSRALARAVWRFPSSADLFNDYGAALLLAGEPEPAGRAFDEALALDADLTTSAVGRARVLEAIRAPAAAAAWLESWCRKRRGAVKGWTELATLLVRMKDLPKAREVMEECYRHNPSSIIELVELLHVMGEDERALAALTEHLARHPDDRAARALLGTLRPSGSPR